ncbi:YT521-B-like domain-containing protein [Usnea florida]
MAGALPEYQSTTSSQISHQDPQRFIAGTPSGSSNYHAPQFPGQAALNNGNYRMQASQYPYQPTYGQIQASQQSPHSGGPVAVQSQYTSGAYFPASSQQYMYYPGHYDQSPQSQHGSYPIAYGHGSSHAYGQQGGDMTATAGRTVHSGYPAGAVMPYSTYGTSGAHLRPGALPGKHFLRTSKTWLTVGVVISRGGSSGSSSGSIPSTPRGPPRKPKQSGHALWVGNLPSGTVISDLKDHFSKDATKDIESVFLISKSNCAFVNYRTEGACAAAMSRFHDSRFQGVRLVCRLRRNPNASAPGVPTGPASLMPLVSHAQTAFEAIQQNREVSSRAVEEAAAESSRTGEPTLKVKDKYFVLKSLTVEDMELSVRNSIWATQSHNEDALNKAYETSENVYLVFSANKSGEYFGVARMASPITDEAAAGLEWAPRGEKVVDDPDVPRSIPTAASGFAPKGRIIDDSARGTIFWEADPEDDELAPIIDHEVDDPEENMQAAEKAEADEAASDAQAFGKPFKIEWLATNRLPFYRTRGLRNPWNSNREVKIARDGTELETSVGRRLVQMFQMSPSLEGPQLAQAWSPY